MPLKDINCRNAKPQDKTYRLYDEQGLYLEVQPNGGRYWRLKYRFLGKEKRLAFGVYPEVGLLDARKKRDKARAQLAAGHDPSLQKRMAKAVSQFDHQHTFESVAQHWLTVRESSWDPEYTRTVKQRLELNAFRSSFSTIMRGIAHLRSDPTFVPIHPEVDVLLDTVPTNSNHLLEVDTNRLHYLRCLRFRSTPLRLRYIKSLFDRTQSDVLHRACIECWRSWKDNVAYNHLRNRWNQLSPDCQRVFWLSTYTFGDEGNAARGQFKHALPQAWALGVEVPLDEKKDAGKLKTHPRGAEPRFSTLYQEWSAEMKDAD